MKTIVIRASIILIRVSITHCKLIEGYGFKSGISIANQDFTFTEDLHFDTKNRTGFDIGVYIEWFSVPFFGVLTEVHYIQKGMIDEIMGIDEYGNETGTIRYDNRVDYLTFPFLVRILFENKYMSPYLLIGPRFDFLLGYDSQHGVLYDEFKKVDIGGDIGIGVEINSTEPLTVLIEGRYSSDFTDACKTDYLRVKNKVFEILVGLEF